MSYSANIQDVIDKRLASLEYLRKVHGGTICWLNTVHMSKRDFDNLYLDDNSKQQQATPLNPVNYYYLGGSVTTICEQNKSSLTDYLKTFLSLLKEYEQFIGQSENTPKNRIAGVGRRLFRSRLKSSSDHSHAMNNNTNGNGTSNYSNDTTISSTRSHSISSITSNKLSPVSSSLPSSTSATTAIQAYSKHDYSHLNLYQLPFIPDVYETFMTLCDSLLEAYKHIKTFLKPGLQVHHDCYELLLKVDEKLRKHVISPTVKDIDSLSRSLIYEETTKLDGLLIQSK